MNHAYQLDNLRLLYGEKIALTLPDLIVKAGKFGRNGRSQNSRCRWEIFSGVNRL